MASCWAVLPARSFTGPPIGCIRKASTLQTCLKCNQRLDLGASWARRQSSDCHNCPSRGNRTRKIGVLVWVWMATGPPPWPRAGQSAKHQPPHNYDAHPPVEQGAEGRRESMQPSGVGQMHLDEDHVFAGVAARWSGSWVEAGPTRDSHLHGQIESLPSGRLSATRCFKTSASASSVSRRQSARPARSSFKTTSTQLLPSLLSCFPIPIRVTTPLHPTTTPGRPRDSTPRGGFTPVEHESGSCR